jgi:hypothetical protein
MKSFKNVPILFWRAWEESNLRTRLRRPVLYPLSYRRPFLIA